MSIRGGLIPYFYDSQCSIRNVCNTLDYFISAKNWWDQGIDRIKIPSLVIIVWAGNMGDQHKCSQEEVRLVALPTIITKDL